MFCKQSFTQVSDYATSAVCVRGISAQCAEYAGCCPVINYTMACSDLYMCISNEGTSYIYACAFTTMKTRNTATALSPHVHICLTYNVLVRSITRISTCLQSLVSVLHVRSVVVHVVALDTPPQRWTTISTQSR